MSEPTIKERLDATEERVRKGLRAQRIAGVVFLIAAVLTAWQISKAFDGLEHERNARINAAASINTFLCQRIDSVGNGVAALVQVSLKQTPDPEELAPPQRLAYNRFVRYAEAQEKPPRCRELALKIATLTGADPEQIVITPIHLHSGE